MASVQKKGLIIENRANNGKYTDLENCTRYYLESMSSSEFVTFLNILGHF